MKEKIDLLEKYIEKAKGLEEENSDYNFIAEQIENMIAYRLIRVEQAWFAKASEGEKDSEERRKIAAMLVEYDKRRREAHNSALRAINIINRFSETNNLPKFYEGPQLTSEQIKTHSIDSLDARKDITDFMLKFIHTLQEQSYTKERKTGFIDNLAENVKKTDRDFGVAEPLLEDDGNVEFKKDSIIK